MLWKILDMGSGTWLKNKRLLAPERQSCRQIRIIPKESSKSMVVAIWRIFRQGLTNSMVTSQMRKMQFRCCQRSEQSWKVETAYSLPIFLFCNLYTPLWPQQSNSQMQHKRSSKTVTLLYIVSNVWKKPTICGHCRGRSLPQLHSCFCSLWILQIKPWGVK